MVKKNYDDMLSRFHLIPERYGRTDGRTDRFVISISHVSMLTRDKNYPPRGSVRVRTPTRGRQGRCSVYPHSSYRSHIVHVTFSDS